MQKKYYRLIIILITLTVWLISLIVYQSRNNLKFKHCKAQVYQNCDGLDNSNDPLNVYILIDESKSANTSDPDNIRYEIAKETIRFIAAYGWVSNNCPYVEVYQYSQAFQGNTGMQDLYRLWPEKERAKKLALTENLALDVKGRVGTLSEAFEALKENNTGYVDRPNLVLENIKNRIFNRVQKI